MSHIWMSHDAHMDVWDESWHAYGWVILHVWTYTSHGTHVNASWHAYEWGMVHIWMSHGTHVKESWHTYAHIYGTYLNETWYTHKKFIALLRTCRHGTHLYIDSHELNESISRSQCVHLTNSMSFISRNQWVYLRTQWVHLTNSMSPSHKLNESISQTQWVHLTTLFQVSFHIYRGFFSWKYRALFLVFDELRCSLTERISPPPGGFSFWVVSKWKAQKKRTPLKKPPIFGTKFGWFFRGVPFPRGSSSRTQPKRKPSSGGGVGVQVVPGRVAIRWRPTK